MFSSQLLLAILNQNNNLVIGWEVFVKNVLKVSFKGMDIGYAPFLMNSPFLCYERVDGKKCYLWSLVGLVFL